MTLNPLAVPYADDDDVSRGADSAHESTDAATERVVSRLLAVAENPAGRSRPRLVVAGDRDADWPTPDTDPAAAQAMLHTICWDSSYTEYDHALAARGAIAASRQQSGSWRGLPPHEDAEPLFRLALEDRDIVLDAVHALGIERAQLVLHAAADHRLAIIAHGPDMDGQAQIMRLRHKARALPLRSEEKGLVGAHTVGKLRNFLQAASAGIRALGVGPGVEHGQSHV